MDINEIKKSLMKAGRANEPMFFAFGIADNEGKLILSRRRRGRAIQHDLVQEEGHRELESRRFGAVSFSPDTKIATFMPDKKFDPRGFAALGQLIKECGFKGTKQEEAGEEDDGEDTI